MLVNGVRLMHVVLTWNRLINIISAYHGIPVML